MANKYAYRVHLDHPQVGNDFIGVIATDAEMAISKAKGVYLKRFHKTMPEFAISETLVISVERGQSIEA